MLKKLITGAIISGVVTFLWNSVSWALLPWHTITYRGFEDETAVVRAIQENAPREGMYAVPYAKPIPAGTRVDEARAIQASFQEKFRSGPIVLVSLQPRGRPSMVAPFAGALGIQMAAGLLITWLLLQTRGLGYWRRVGFVVTAALVAAVLGHLPYWNWWGFPDQYTVAAVADVAEGWFLAGLVLARVAAPEEAAA